MPIYPRVMVWIIFVVAILVAAALATITLAGSPSPDRQRWPLFFAIFVGACFAQSGYVLAPFVLGRSGWMVWIALVLMGPVVLLILAGISSPV